MKWEKYTTMLENKSGWKHRSNADKTLSVKQDNNGTVKENK